MTWFLEHKWPLLSLAVFNSGLAYFFDGHLFLGSLIACLVYCLMVTVCDRVKNHLFQKRSIDVHIRISWIAAYYQVEYDEVVLIGNAIMIGDMEVTQSNYEEVWEWVGAMPQSTEKIYREKFWQDFLIRYQGPT